MSFKSYRTMDVQMLLGLVNTALRNDCENLDDLVKRHDLDEAILRERLATISMSYHSDLNQFRPSSRLKPIVEIRRIASPCPLPQSITWDGKHFWIASMATKFVYQLSAKIPERGPWKAIWETKSLGTPFGMVSVGDELRVLCGETRDDHRVIRRCMPDRGFDWESSIPCPDDTGSQLSFDGKNLHISQWYNKRVLQINNEGVVLKSIISPHGICGQVIVGDVLYLATTDDENHGDYWITRINLLDDSQPPEDIALIPFHARSLTHDGTHFWTNHRANNEIVCFDLPK